jgi:hypothetical protein
MAIMDIRAAMTAGLTALTDTMVKGYPRKDVRSMGKPGGAVRLLLSSRPGSSACASKATGRWADGEGPRGDRNCAPRVCQADAAEAGTRTGLTGSERWELVHLRREHRRLRLDADILKRARASLAKQTR